MIIVSLNKISSGYTIYIGQDGEEPQTGTMAKIEADHPSLVVDTIPIMINLMLFDENGDHLFGDMSKFAPQGYPNE